jgi:hypothetical protein
MARWFSLCGLLVVCLLLASCGKKGPKAVKVAGTVTLDGQPLAEGSLILEGDEKTPPVVLPITAGAFDGEATLGKKMVGVMAYKMVKPPPTSTETGDVKQNYIPERFNEKSTMTAEVTQAGISPNKFDVQSK